MVHVSKWSQDISEANCWAFAYLTSPTGTTIVAGNTYYPIAWSFTNTVLKHFTLVATPAIKYTDGNGIYLKIDWFASVSSDTASTTVKLWIKKNWTLEAGSVMTMFCKNINEIYNVGWTVVVSLANKDEIQLVITSDKTGSILTVQNYTTAINEFFDKL